MGTGYACYVFIHALSWVADGFGLGDVIVAVLDLSVGELSFQVNDENFGVAFTGIDTSKTYFPAMSLLTKQQVGQGLSLF
jgi:hypothetical protein